MVEVAERNLLLALMRRLRRRRRWTAALEGGALALALTAFAAAGVVLLTRLDSGRADAHAPDAQAPVALLVSVLILSLVIGAATRATRPISLIGCARAVDRAAGGPTTGAHGGTSTDDNNAVLAAVALVQEPMLADSAVPFVRALATEALRLVRRVPTARAIPAPRWPILALAAAALGFLSLSATLPRTRSFAPAGFQRARQAQTTSSVATDRVPPIRMTAVALDAESEDAANALRTAEEHGDAELAHTARDLQDLLAELSEALSADAAVARLDALAEGAEAAATLAKAARTADRAARQALQSARTVGGDGAAMANAIAQAHGPEDAAARAAVGLAAHGDTGRSAMAGAATAAAGAIGSLGDGTPRAGSGDERRRRLEHGLNAGQPVEDHLDETGRSGSRVERRHLEELKRDLESEAANCRNDPAACRTGADAAARALSELHRRGATADARQRVAEAARQLLDRIRREATEGTRRAETLRRFTRAARGPAVGATRDGQPADTRTDAPKGTSATGGDQVQTVEGSGQKGADPRSQRQGGEDNDEEQSGEPNQHPGEPAASAAEHPLRGDSMTAEGIGSESGGPVLGPRTPEMGRSSGRDTAVVVASDATGPSRSQIIGGAAAGGFAAVGYRRVFEDYRTAVEESLETTSVPAGRRYLVRRYFQLIRPRSTP